VNTFLEYIDDSAIGSDEEALEFKNIAQRNVFRMKRLIDEMLDLHRLEAGLMPLNKTSFELVSAVEQAKESNLGAAKEKNISTTVEGSATIYADEHRIVQVIANLLDNAIKHAPKDSDVKVMIAREDDCVTVSVVDNGPGIPPDLRSKIFEPFQQGPDATEADRRGFGLGLAVCREIIEAHSGRIFVSSIPSGGTSFSFKIPFKG
jgi:two-component system sensor histidine kinase ResE